MTVRTIPPRPICRINSGPLAPLTDMPVYSGPQSGPLTTELVTRPIPPPPPPTYPLFDALRIGCKTGKHFTIRTENHDAWLTYDPTTRWVTASSVVNQPFWRAMARQVGACDEGAHEMVLGAMLRLFPLLAESQWWVTSA